MAADPDDLLAKTVGNEVNGGSWKNEVVERLCLGGGGGRRKQGCVLSARLCWNQRVCAWSVTIHKLQRLLLVSVQSNSVLDLCRAFSHSGNTSLGRTSSSLQGIRFWCPNFFSGEPHLFCPQLTTTISSFFPRGDCCVCLVSVLVSPLFVPPSTASPNHLID